MRASKLSSWFIQTVINYIKKHHSIQGKHRRALRSESFVYDPSEIFDRETKGEANRMYSLLRLDILYKGNLINNAYWMIELNDINYKPGWLIFFDYQTTDEVISKTNEFCYVN